MGVLERSQAMLTAAILASEQAQELAGLATKLETAADGLAHVLAPVRELHLESIWSGAAASASRQRLNGSYRADLWYAQAMISHFVAELRYAASQAQAEADQLWAQWRLAVYSGQVITQFHFSG